MKPLSFGLLLSLLMLTGMTAPTHADTQYVTEIMQVTLRTGQGTGHKIIAMIDSGKQVEVLESGETWTRVHVDDKEGWMMTRFLTQQKPRVVRLEALEKKYGNLENQYQKLKSDHSALSEENQTLKSDLDDTRSRLSDITNSYQALKNKSENFLKLESQLQKTTEQLTLQSASTEKLEQRLQEKNIYWFLSGAGVLIFGMILGAISFKRKQRRRLL